MDGWRKFATGLLLRWEGNLDFTTLLIRHCGGYTGIASLIFEIQKLPGPDFPLEPPSQQAKQTGVGEQCVDGRVSASVFTN